MWRCLCQGPSPDFGRLCPRKRRSPPIRYHSCPCPAREEPQRHPLPVHGHIDTMTSCCFSVERKENQDPEETCPETFHASLNCVCIFKRKSRDFTPRPFSFFIKCKHLTPLPSFLWMFIWEEPPLREASRMGPLAVTVVRTASCSHATRGSGPLVLVQSRVGPCLPKRTESCIPPPFGGGKFLVRSYI